MKNLSAKRDNALAAEKRKEKERIS